MFTPMKWLSIAGLIGLALGGGSFPIFDILLDVVVCFSAAIIVWEAFRARKYVWAALFLVIVLLFNPIEPFTFSRAYIPWINLACVVTFLASLAAVRKAPKLSVQSITSQLPRTPAL